MEDAPGLRAVGDSNGGAVDGGPGLDPGRAADGRAGPFRADG